MWAELLFCNTDYYQLYTTHCTVCGTLPENTLKNKLYQIWDKKYYAKKSPEKIKLYQIWDKKILCREVSRTAKKKKVHKHPCQFPIAICLGSSIWQIRCG